MQLQGYDALFTPLAGSPAEARAKQYLLVEALPRFSPLELPQALKISAQVRPDLIIAYGGPEMLLAQLLKRSTGARIWRFRGQEMAEPSVIGGFKHKLSHVGIDRILTPSIKLARAIERLDPNTPVAPLQLGVDTTKFWRRPVSPASRPELMILGRLDPVKGHQKAIRMTARLIRAWPKDLPKPCLHVVGEPANLSATHLEHWAKAEGLQVGEDVLLTVRRVPDIAQLLSRATLGWVPSLGSEIICRVAEEFLVCGTPIAVSGVGSLDETLFEGAGFSYGGMSEEQASEVVAAWIRASLQEGEAAKVRRAAEARARFSLAAMGQGFSTLL